jgi:glycine/D-amino acid oxidase-like deaminating enzyme
MLGAVRPSGSRRSWWLREALAAEALHAPHLVAPDAAPPLRGTTTADVVVVGGGYTGLWTAYRLTELEPGARVLVLEQDICGGGPSGRNGGFVTNWWDELPTLVERYGEAGALAMARAVEAAVDHIGAWCEDHGVDAWYRRAGSLSVSAAPAQDGGWERAVDACRRLGVEGALVPLSPDEVAARVRSPVFRAGVLMPAAATIQPATLARGLRRVLLERGVRIHEGTTVTQVDGVGRALSGRSAARPGCHHRVAGSPVARGPSVSARSARPVPAPSIRARPCSRSTPGRRAGRASAVGSSPGPRTWSSPSRSRTGSPRSAR